MRQIGAFIDIAFAMSLITGAFLMQDSVTYITFISVFSVIMCITIALSSLSVLICSTETGLFVDEHESCRRAISMATINTPYGQLQWVISLLLKITLMSLCGFVVIPAAFFAAHAALYIASKVYIKQFNVHADAILSAVTDAEKNKMFF